MSYVVIDFETTGFDAGDDEVLSCSIIDDEGDVKFDSLFKPLHYLRWDAAEVVHGITPAMVINKEPFDNYVHQVKAILDAADYVVAYNVQFERSFLEAYGIDTNAYTWEDPMIIFANIYAEWSEKYNRYRWQTLGTCADYYKYEFKAHNSLEDVKATLHCYKLMLQDTADGRKRVIDEIDGVRYYWICYEDGSGGVSTNRDGSLAHFDLQTREVYINSGWTFTDICTFKDVKDYIYDVLGIKKGDS